MGVSFGRWHYELGYLTYKSVKNAQAVEKTRRVHCKELASQESTTDD